MSHKITCVVVDDEPMARDILISYIERVPNLVLVKSCKNALEALTISQQEKIDLFFLDINMPEVSGLSLAKLVGNASKVIFTTAYRDYAVDGFDLKAVDYLLKPIGFDRFLTAVNTFLGANSGANNQTSQVSPSSEFFFVRSDRKMVKINLNEILYIESLSDYLKIITDNGTVVTRETITNIQEKLPEDLFLRIHRSFIVSLNKIDSYTNEFVEINKKAIPISRSYKAAILEKLEKN